MLNTSNFDQKMIFYVARYESSCTSSSNLNLSLPARSHKQTTWFAQSKRLGSQPAEKHRESPRSSRQRQATWRRRASIYHQLDVKLMVESRSRRDIVLARLPWRRSDAIRRQPSCCFELLPSSDWSKKSRRNSKPTSAIKHQLFSACKRPQKPTSWVFLRIQIFVQFTRLEWPLCLGISNWWVLEILFKDIFD